MKTFPPHFFIVEVHQQPEWVDPRIFEFMSPDQKAFFQSKKLERESNRILFVVGSTFTNQTIGYIKKGVIPSDIRDDYSGTSSQEGRKNLEGVWDDYDYLEFYLTSGIFVGYAYKDSFLGEEQISIRRPDGKRIGIINAKLENRSSFWMPSAFRRRYLSRDIIDYSKPNNSVQSFSLKEYPTRFLYSKLDWKSDKDVKKETVCDVVSKWFLGTISSNSTSNVENSIHPAILVFMYSFDSLEKRKAKSLLYQKFSNIFYHLTNPFSKKKSRTTEKMED